MSFIKGAIIISHENHRPKSAAGPLASTSKVRYFEKTTPKGGIHVHMEKVCFIHILQESMTFHFDHIPSTRLTKKKGEKIK